MIDKVLSNQTLLFINCIPTRAKSLNDILQIIFFSWLVSFFCKHKINLILHSINIKNKYLLYVVTIYIWLQDSLNISYEIHVIEEKRSSDLGIERMLWIVLICSLVCLWEGRSEDWNKKLKSYNKNNNNIEFVL